MDPPVDSVLPDAGISTKGSVTALTYEQQMDLDPEWAMSEGSRHFDENSRVFLALKHIAQRLSALSLHFGAFSRSTASGPIPNFAGNGMFEKLSLSPVRICQIG